MYFPLRKHDKSSIRSLLNCLHEVKLWMSANVLSLNETKTEVIWFGNSESQVLSDLGNLATFQKSVVKNLGVQFDVSLKFDKQIKSVVKSCFFHLRLLAKVKPFRSPSNLEKLIHAFIFVRLDYCNSLYAGVSKSLISLTASAECCCEINDGCP